jgi:hypothetical protein
MKTTFGVLALSLATLAGCSSDYTLDFEYLDAPPGVVSLDNRQVLLEDGVAVAVLARPLEDNDRMDWETQLDLQSSNLRTFDIDRLEYDDERELRKDEDLRDGDWSFLLWGREPGNAVLEVWIDGELEREIPVTVSRQEE